MDFNSILIGSEDPQALIDYYGRLFGDPSWVYEDYTGWQLGSGFLTIGPHSEVKGKSVHPGRIIWNLETTDVVGDFERMKQAGATVVREPYTMEGAPDDSYIATLEDPDGNYFQLNSPMDPNAM